MEFIANSAIHSDSTSSSLVRSIRTVTADYSATSSDYTILADGTNVAVTITLPSAGTCEGQIFVIKAINIDNQVDINTNGGTIDGSATYVFVSVNVSIAVQSNGINYYII